MYNSNNLASNRTGANWGNKKMSHQTSLNLSQVILVRKIQNTRHQRRLLDKLYKCFNSDLTPWFAFFFLVNRRNNLCFSWEDYPCAVLASDETHKGEKCAGYLPQLSVTAKLTTTNKNKNLLFGPNWNNCWTKP